MKRKPDFSLPAIGRYVEALGAPYGLFRTLGDVSPEYDACGAPVFIAGNYAAVFRIRTADGKRRALKCYIRPTGYAEAICEALGRVRSPYLVECRYLPDELYVFDLAGQGSYRSVVLMEWADGEPLGRCLARLCGSDDREGLGALARRFDRLGSTCLRWRAGPGWWPLRRLTGILCAATGFSARRRTTIRWP